jgi:hypothetical protein
MSKDQVPIPDTPEGLSVRDYFRAMGLDPVQPEHWYVLAEALIDEARSRARAAKAGAPMRWTADRLTCLAADFYRLQREHPHKSERNLCSMLTRRSPYRGTK